VKYSHSPTIFEPVECHIAHEYLSRGSPALYLDNNWELSMSEWC